MVKDTPAPSKPNAATLAHRRLDGDSQASLATRFSGFRRGYPVGYDDQTVQNASSQDFDKRIAELISPTIE